MTIPDVPEYQALTDVLETHTDWEREDSDEDYEIAMEQAASGGVNDGELRYRHAETDAPLHVFNMGYSEVSITLDQVFDMNLIDGGHQSPLKDALETAYENIAETHATEYLRGGGSVLSPVAAVIPQDYDLEEVERTVDALSAASSEIQDHHDEILATAEG